MATVFLSPAFTLNSVDLVGRIRSVSLTHTVSAVDSSDVSSVDDEFLAGSQSWTLSITMLDDTATSSVEPSLFVIYAGRAAVPFTLRRSSDAVAADNPQYSGNVLLTEVPFLDGNRGDVLEMSCSFQGTGALARATS